jgi:uncharacterized protein YaiE (UPF0345 family)
MAPRRGSRAMKHNTYFDAKVQSLGFERNGRKQTVGVIEPGEYHFGTDGAERMTVVCGELHARIGSGPWQCYPAGTSFEVAAKSGFDVKAAAPSAYWCEFI